MLWVQLPPENKLTPRSAFRVAFFLLSEASKKCLWLFGILSINLAFFGVLYYVQYYRTIIAIFFWKYPKIPSKPSLLIITLHVWIIPRRQKNQIIECILIYWPLEQNVNWSQGFQCILISVFYFAWKNNYFLVHEHNLNFYLEVKKSNTAKFALSFSRLKYAALLLYVYYYVGKKKFRLELGQATLTNTPYKL